MIARAFIPTHADNFGVLGSADCPECGQRTNGRIPHRAPETFHCSACCKRHHLPLTENGPVFDLRRGVRP